MSDSEDLSDITTSLYNGSNGNELRRGSYRKYLREITALINCFNSYMFESKTKDVSSAGSS